MPRQVPRGQAKLCWSSLTQAELRNRQRIREHGAHLAELYRKGEQRPCVRPRSPYSQFCDYRFILQATLNCIPFKYLDLQLFRNHGAQSHTGLS